MFSFIIITDGGNPIAKKSKFKIIEGTNSIESHLAIIVKILWLFRTSQANTPIGTKNKSWDILSETEAEFTLKKVLANNKSSPTP